MMRMRKLAAVFLYSALGWAGGILFVLGALWWFSPSPLPLAPVLLAVALAVILIAWARLHKDETLVENGVSVPAQVTEICPQHRKNQLWVIKRHRTARTLTSCIINTILTAKEYTGRSRLLWAPPKVPENRRIHVYLDPARPARSALDFPHYLTPGL